MSEPQPEWKCPACGKTQVLKFARCQFCGTPAAPPHSEPSSLSGGTHHRSIAVRSDKATKQQMIAGICLILLGAAMEFSRNTFLAGIAISVVGLALFARARRHRLSSARTTKRKWSWAVRLFVSLVISLVLLMASCLGLVQVSHREVNAFYAGAKDGMLLVEALEQHPRWAYINFGEKLIEEAGSDHSRAGRNDCGSVKHHRNENELSFIPVDYAESENTHWKSYSGVRDLFRVNPQVFARCSWVYVTYPVLMFGRGRVVVQVDAQGKIILAKEPVYWGD